MEYWEALRALMRWEASALHGYGTNPPCPDHRLLDHHLNPGAFYCRFHLDGWSGLQATKGNGTPVELDLGDIPVWICGLLEECLSSGVSGGCLKPQGNQLVIRMWKRAVQGQGR